MDASEIDWETINEQMPYDHSEESHARRREIWNGMNVNGNKFLSLAEVDKGVIDVRSKTIHFNKGITFVLPPFRFLVLRMSLIPSVLLMKHSTLPKTLLR